MTLGEAADKLALATGLSTEKCAEAVARILSVMGRREDLRGGTSDRDCRSVVLLPCAADIRLSARPRRRW
jgi:hypothetical protein